MKSDEIYFQIKFTDTGVDFRYVGDKRYFERFCGRQENKIGYIIVCAGEIEKSVRQLRFFFGPLIDAFVRLTGNADRQLWKDYLKANFLMRDEPEEIPSLADISMRRMSRFIQSSIDHLVDEGGYLDEFEKREFDVVRIFDEEKK